MLTITYDFIHTLVSAFADLHSNADRLAWIQGHKRAFGAERAAQFVLDEYWHHQYAWHVVHDTITEGRELPGQRITADKTIWASYDVENGKRTAGVGIVEWQPKGGVEKQYRNHRQIFDAIEIRSRPPLPTIPGVMRQYFMQRSMLVIDLQIPNTSPAGLDQGMDLLLLVTADMQRMLTIHPRNGAALPKNYSEQRAGDTCQYFMFRFLAGNDMLDEQQFFAQYCVDPTHDPKVIRFIGQVNQEVMTIDKSSRRDERWFAYEKFQNDFMNPGSFAITELALRDRAYVGLLATKIEEWDMDHESWHHRVIDRVLQKHGPCVETLELLAARMGRGWGQAGGENLLTVFHDPVYRTWLNKGKRWEQMLERALRPARNDLAQGINPFRAFQYASRFRSAAELWGLGDISIYHQGITRAEKILGTDVRYVRDWEEDITRYAPKERLTRIPTWKKSVALWDEDCRFYLDLELPKKLIRLS